MMPLIVVKDGCIDRLGFGTDESEWVYCADMLSINHNHERFIGEVHYLDSNLLGNGWFLITTHFPFPQYVKLEAGVLAERYVDDEESDDE